MRRACPYMFLLCIQHYVSTLYTTLPNNETKTSGFDRVDLQKGIKNYGSLYLACNDRKAFSLPLTNVDIHVDLVKVCDALSYLLDNIYIRFGTKLDRQIVPMGTNCAPLVADLFLYCYERDFMDSLNHDNQTDVIRLLILLLGTSMTF